MEANDQHDFRKILVRELERRLQRNPSYSMRAFARDLKVSPSRLNDVLKGRYGLSKQASAKIALLLELPEWERKQFTDMVEAKHARSFARRQIARARLRKYETLGFVEMKDDLFQLISEWYHFAILELTYLSNFKSDSLWISKSLDISQRTAEQAVERLLRLKLLEKKGSRMQATEDFSAVGRDTPSSAIKEFHAQLLACAAQALHKQPVENREFGSMILAFRKQDLPAAKATIRKFRRKFSEGNRNSVEKDAVYCLGVQFFELTSD